MANISSPLGFRFSEAQEYAQCVCDSKKIYSNGDFPESVKKDPVRFGYTGTTLESFKKYHSPEGSLRRIFTAIPLALVALVKCVGNLFCAAVPGFSSEKFLSLKLRKASLFSSVRNLEESMGRIATMFNDVRGSYHVQQAQFQKKYYSVACGTLITPHQYHQIYAYQSYRNPLSELLGKSEDEKNILIEQFQLKKCVEACASLGGFWNLLQNADQEMLKLFSVDDLRYVFHKELLEGESFKIPLFLQPKDTILKITVHDVEKLGEQEDLPKDTSWRVRERLLQEEAALPLPDQKNIANMTFLTFLHLSPEILDEIAQTIPDTMYGYVSEKQAATINLSKLSPEQLLSFITLPKDPKISAARLQRTSFEQLSRIKDKLNQLSGRVWHELSPEKIAEFAPIIPAERFQYFSKEEVQKVDFSKLSEEQLQQFILASGNENRQKEHLPLVSFEQLSRIKTVLNQLPGRVWHELSPEKIAEFAPLIPAERFQYFSKEEVQKIDFSKLSEEQLQQFILASGNENRQKEHLPLLSLEQLSRGKTVLNQLPGRVWHELSPEKIAEFAPIIPADRFQYFSKEEVQKIDFSKLSEEQLQQFILASGNENRQKEHLPLLSLEQLSRGKTVLNQLPGRVWHELSPEKIAEFAPIIPAERFQYFSKEEVQKIDFSKLSEEQLQQFILASGNENRQKEHLPLLSLEQLSRGKTVLNQLPGRVWHELSPEKIAEFAPIIPAERFQYFSKEEVQKIDFSKLSEEQLQQFILASGNENRQKEHLPLLSLEQLSRGKTVLNQLQWGTWHALSAEKIAEFAPIIPAVHFRYYSNDQLKKVDFSKLSDDKLIEIIVGATSNEREARLKLIPVGRIKANKDIMDLLNADELRSLLSRLS